MAEHETSQQPEYIVTPIDPPRAVATVCMMIVVVCGLLMVWVQSLHPFIGVPLDHPGCLIVMGIFVLGGIGSVIHIWISPTESWRKVPAGPLSLAVRELADSGKKREAIEQLRQETDAGLFEAARVIEDYLARKV
ncbi:MAG: hypothetical protein L0241_03030 [Planctomycetia bacterium]|nr:hypothetical protein [Planctomycetia bacterium]